MKKLILIVTLTATSAFAELSDYGDPGPTGSKYFKTAQKADQWACDYFKSLLDSIGPLKANGMSVMITGAVVIAQEKLEQVASQLTDNPDSQFLFVEEATSSLKLYAEGLQGIFFAYPNSPKQAFQKAKEYLNEENE